VEAALLVFPPVLAVSLLLAFLASREQVARVLRRIAVVLTGDRPSDAGPVMALAASQVWALAVLAHKGGVWLAATLSAPYAISGTLALEALLFVVATLVVVIAGPSLTRAAIRVVACLPRLKGALLPETMLVLLIASGALVIVAWVRVSYAMAPVIGSLGVLAGLLFSPRLPTLSTRRLVRSWLGAGAAMAAAAIILLPRLPADARLVTLVRSPYASLLVGAVHAVIDHDHDGYSPVLFGGDCNDHDASVNPGARDIPGNGIDENCSGADANAYVPPPAPRLPRPAALAEHMNIVMLQLDALRPDHLRFNGYARPTSPRLDRFRAHATHFRRAYTPSPTTRYAMASAFTGLSPEAVPQEHGSGIDFTLLPAAVTVAERLAPLGYDRVGYSISYVVQHIRDMGQGYGKWETPWPVDEWGATYMNAATLTTQAGLGYLRGLPPGHAPFLLFLHYQCTHDPYSARPEWSFGHSDVDKYDSAAAYCDDEVGRLLDEVDARDDRDLTAVIVFSDHGEMLGDHGLEAHGTSLFEGDVRSLFMMRLPGAPPRTIDEAVTLMDLAPTVLDLAGLPLPRASDAWSLVPYAYGDARPPARSLSLMTDHWRGPARFHARGLVEGRYKYVRELSSGSEHLYDLERDPGEVTDLTPVMPELHARFVEALDARTAPEAR
jgi:arylsulfatase A-like enzyme